MPKTGFKSLTVPTAVYVQHKKKFELDRQKLRLQGITTFSAYVSKMMWSEIHETEILKKYKEKFRVIEIQNAIVIIQDSDTGKVIEVRAGKDGVPLQCVPCGRGDCMHVGFCYSIYQIYGKMIT